MLLAMAMAILCQLSSLDRVVPCSIKRRFYALDWD
jgi:hypothetical protein